MHLHVPSYRGLDGIDLVLRDIVFRLCFHFRTSALPALVSEIVEANGIVTSQSAAVAFAKDTRYHTIVVMCISLSAMD